MWWEKKARPVTTLVPKPSVAPPATLELEQAMNETTGKLSNLPASGSPQTVLGKTAVVRGQLSGSEDLLIEGQYEGTITLQDHCLTVGADGQVKAEIHARQVVILGSVTGNIAAREKIAIRRSGHVVGDLVAAAVAIEEGAYFKGSIDILREEPQEVARAAAAPSAFGSGS
jgi:cytoskeletal protein CcmA (bactofilin family)